ncbi:unnamed protein product, partial [Hapterophycus canaliculatus]
LWTLLKRRSRARAEPLLPSVETSIKSLDPRGLLSPPPTEEEEASAASSSSSPSSGGILPQGFGSSTAAAAAAEVSAPQAVGGAGWNLFGFFPKDKVVDDSSALPTLLEDDDEDEDDDEEEEEGEGQEETRGVVVSKAVASAAATAAKLASTSASSSTERAVAAEASGGDATASAWPKSAWLEGLDPRAQVEAAMREALRSAFGYSGLVVPAAGVPPETLEAATLAAGNAAVAEGTKQLLEGQSMSPTARYLDELGAGTGSSGGGGEAAAAAAKRTADGLWVGAEAAAYAAGAAAG